MEKPAGRRPRIRASDQVFALLPRGAGASTSSGRAPRTRSASAFMVAGSSGSSGRPRGGRNLVRVTPTRGSSSAAADFRGLRSTGSECASRLAKVLGRAHRREAIGARANFASKRTFEAHIAPAGGLRRGTYDLQLLDSSLTSKASATGSAEIRDYITTLHASLELTIVEPGSYQLAIRRHGEDWRLFPIRVE
jgi:hypothetical protein